MKVAIIGGGVIGLCTAYYLNKSGYQVTLIEKNDLTAGCSFGNMGYVSPSHFVPLATPGIIAQGIKWMMSASSPFYIKPRLNIDLLNWGLRFKNCAKAKNVEEAAPHLNNLLQLSRRLLPDLKTDLPPFDLVERGCWMLYKSAKTGEHEKHLAEQAASFGLKTEICGPSEVQAREPDVEVKVAGGVLYIDDCHLNPQQFMQSLYRYLQSHGVEFWLNSPVNKFEINGSRINAVITDHARLATDELVIANGSWLQEISKLLNIRILMQPGKGYSMAYQQLDKNLYYPSILVDDRTATAPIGSLLRIGGTMELSGHSDNILPKRVMSIYNAFRKYYPSMDIPAPDPSNAWFGYRPVSPDGMPYIGRHSRFDNLCYAGGHAMLGISAATGTGMLIEQIIGGKRTEIPVSAFNPERFS